MKTNNVKQVAAILMLLIIILFMAQCKRDDPKPQLPMLISFTPLSGKAQVGEVAGTSVTITGMNFSTTAGDNEVKFNNVVAMVNTATRTQLTTTVPAGATTGKISITVNGSSVEFVTDFIVTETWERLTDYPGSVGLDAAGFAFSINGKGYAGGSGSLGNDTYNKAFFEYDPATDSWTQKQDFKGSARLGATGFVIESLGYMGTGYDGNFLKDFWKYDPVVNNWVQLNNFGGEACRNAVGFSIGTKGYIVTGERNPNGFWEYDSKQGSWKQLPDFPGNGRWGAFGFTIGSKGYIGAGGNGPLDDQTFWEFDPTLGWSQQADHPEGGQFLVAFSIASRGYAGDGTFFEFNPTLNKWTKRTSMNGSVYRGIAFTIGNYGYTTGGAFGALSKKLYRYTPDF